MARKNRHRPWPPARNAALRQRMSNPKDWYAEVRQRLLAGRRRRQQKEAKP